MRVWPVLLFLMLAAPLRADPACDTVAALGRVVTSAQDRDVAMLNRALRRIDAARAMWNLAGHPLVRHRTEIEAALRIAADWANAARGPGLDRAPLSPEDEAALARLEALLAGAGCGDEIGAPGASGLAERKAGAVAGSGGWQAIRLVGVGVAALVVAGSGGALVWILVRHGQRRRRREQRHSVNLPARLRSGGEEIEARLLDISRLGAKLRIDPGVGAPDPSRIMLFLGDREIEAAPRWRNTHYLGVQFVKPLSEEMMAPLIQPARGPREGP